MKPSVRGRGRGVGAVVQPRSPPLVVLLLLSSLIVVGLLSVQPSAELGAGDTERLSSGSTTLVEVICKESRKSGGSANINALRCLAIEKK